MVRPPVTASTIAAASVAVCAAALLVGGCSSTPSGDSDLMARQKEYFASLAEQAKSGDASKTQIDALVEASHTGELTTEMVTELYDPLFQCFASLGGKGEVFGTVTIAPGIVVPDYRVGFTADDDAKGGAALNQQVQDCENRNVAFVWQALYLQPVAQQARDDQMMASLVDIRECLDKLGISLPAEPTVAAVTKGVAEGQSQGTHCYQEPEFGDS